MESFYINFYIEDKKVKGVDFNTCIEFLLYYIYIKATFLVVRWLREHRGPRFDSWSGNESPHAATKTQKFLKNKQLPWRPVVRTRWFCHIGAQVQCLV